MSQTISSTSNSDNWKSDQPKITLEDLQGKRSCLMALSDLFNTSPMLIPVAMHSRLTTGVVVECISSLRDHPSCFCYQLNEVYLFWNCLHRRRPHSSFASSVRHSVVVINNGEEGKVHPNLDSGLPCAWRAIPILIPPLVRAGVTDSNAIETSALFVEDKNFNEFSAQGDIDLGYL